MAMSTDQKKDTKKMNSWWAEVIGISLFPQIATILFQLVLTGSLKNINWTDLFIHGELVLTASIVSLTSAMHGFQHKKDMSGFSFYLALFSAVLYVGFFALIKAVQTMNVSTIVFLSIICPIASFFVSFSLEKQIKEAV